MLKEMKVRPSVVMSDESYQRPLDDKVVAQMAETINVERIGVPVLAMRTDGSVYVLDGQHRIAALVTAGLGDKPILCQVHEGLSLEQEASWFLLLNDDRRQVDAMAKYKARLVCNEPVALEIDKIVRRSGMRIGCSSGVYSISAVKAIEWIHKRGNLREVLRVAKSWAEIDRRNSLDGYMLKAISRFLKTYPEADPGVMARRCVKHSPSITLARIKEQARMFNVEFAAATMLREVYNVRGKPLPPIAWGNE